jgi:DeoR/GlpR family transcriptional regulator of sugar metabolism
MGKQMYPFERKTIILEKLRKNGQITIQDDARSLGISVVTLHRDLEKLATQGVLRKVRGGAIFTGDSSMGVHFDIRSKMNVSEKEEIARKAVAAITDDTSIFLDHSSTTLFLARELKSRHFHSLLLVTNSLVIPEELAGIKGIQVLLTGGVVESGYKALSGRWVIETLERINLHQVFASAAAISPERGLMTQSLFIHEILPSIFTRCARVNVLLDHSKFYKIATYPIVPLGPSLTIFSDKGLRLPMPVRAEIEKTGAKIII